MKVRRRYSTSSGESEESAQSAESADSDSSSGSEASESASSARVRRDRKHKRRAPSSDSDSEEEKRRRAKKRKHKKKKRKHGKKRRRSDSASDDSSESEAGAGMDWNLDERPRKRKREKRRRKKSSSRSPSVQEVPVEAPKERSRGPRSAGRLQSVVQGRRRSTSPHRQTHRHHSPPPSRYYDRHEERKYERSVSAEYAERPREAEVERFYRGSSKDRSVRQEQSRYRHQSRYSTVRSEERKYEHLVSAEYAERPREAEVERFYRGSSKDRSVRQEQSRYRHQSRYEEREPERYEGYGGGRELGNGSGDQYGRPRRSDNYHQYSQSRPVKYEQEEYDRDARPLEDARYGERSHRGREYNPRQHTYSQHDDRTRHQDKSGPICLVCGEVHAGGQACRAAPPPRLRDRGDRSRADGERSERGDDKRTTVKRERERAHREEREHSRPSGERRERSPVGSPRRDQAREHSSASRRDARPKSPRRDERERSRHSERRAKESERREPAERVREGANGRKADAQEGERRDTKERGERERSPQRKDRKSRFAEEDGKSYSWGKTEVKKESAPEDKDKPNFGLSGALAAEANTVNGIVLKYSEPPDSKQPKRRWRFYPFKGDKALPILYIHRQSCFILGRDHKAVDIPLEHPSVSKQHAALQYRATPYTRPDGTQARRVRPYIIDLESANGTFVNNKKIEVRRFVELLERDVVKFGFSQREYVLLHENSKDDAADDDQEMTAGGGGGGGGAGEGGAVTSIATVKREKQIKRELTEDGE